jgi:hypothetical protein
MTFAAKFGVGAAVRRQKSESREGLVVCVEMADLAAKIENARKEVADLKNKVRFLSFLPAAAHGLATD